jgi:hypothetical protein
MLLLWTVDFRALRARRNAVQREAIRSHQATYQRNASATYADRLKRMRDLIERLDREEHKKEAGSVAEPGKTTKEPVAAPPANAPTTEPAEKQNRDVSELWRESREQYEALRERYQEKRARTLAELTKTDLETARKEIQAGRKDVLNGQRNAPTDAAQAASQIAKMHGDAQGMLNEMVQRSRTRTEGQRVGSGSGGGTGAGSGSAEGTGVGADSAREAYLLGQNEGGSPETQNFDKVVDYTPLMLSRGPRVNSKLDTDEDRRRVESMRSWTLTHHFNETSDQVRFTRRIGGTGAAPAAWVAPDAWYIIGPFPNRWRSEIETSFPPELEIDRDAVYEGRDGRPLFWRYVNTRRIGVIPPDMEDFAVYYAYTEVNCAAPLDCWLAIGSDDYSKVWVNGLLVWSGSKDEKIWNPTEGFRRVHLDQGVNRLLLRLENGINGCEFSVLIALE